MSAIFWDFSLAWTKKKKGEKKEKYIHDWWIYVCQRRGRGSSAFSPLFSCGLQMGFVISQCSLMDDRSLPVIRIKYKEGHKWVFSWIFISEGLRLCKNKGVGSESVTRPQRGSFFSLLITENVTHWFNCWLCLADDYQGVNSRQIQRFITFLQ